MAALTPNHLLNKQQIEEKILGLRDRIRELNLTKRIILTFGSSSIGKHVIVASPPDIDIVSEITQRMNEDITFQIIRSETFYIKGHGVNMSPYQTWDNIRKVGFSGKRHPVDQIVDYIEIRRLTWSGDAIPFLWNTFEREDDIIVDSWVNENTSWVNGCFRALQNSDPQILLSSHRYGHIVDVIIPVTLSLIVRWK